jgi:hypothetical protein
MMTLRDEVMADDYAALIVPTNFIYVDIGWWGDGGRLRYANRPYELN